MLALVRPWLLAQGGLLLAGVLLFGLAFPLLGVLIGITGTAPPGEDPLGIALGLGLAGPCTAGIYLPGAVLSLVAARRVAADPMGAFGLVLAASVCGSVICPLALVPLVLYLVGRDGQPTRTSTV